jgi:hypothetical protein
MFPETSGKSLEEITAIFEDPHGIKYIGTPAWKTHNSYRHTSKAERGDVSDDAEYGRNTSVTEKDGKVSEEKEASPERRVVDGTKVA